MSFLKKNFLGLIFKQTFKHWSQEKNTEIILNDEIKENVETKEYTK